MGILLKGGTIITEEKTLLGDLKIEGESIEAIGTSITPIFDDKVIDVTGQYVLPGIIDAHVHYKMPINKVYTIDNFDTGSRAALCGGVTTVIDYAQFVEGYDMIGSLDHRVKEAIGHSFVDYSMHMTLSGDALYSLDDILKFKKYGINSIKLYTTYNFMLEYKSIEAILIKAAELDMVVTVHSEDNTIIQKKIKELKAKGKTAVSYHAISRPSISEIKAVEALIDICEKNNVGIHIVHVSSGYTAEIIEAAKKRGVKVTAETCPHYLMLNSDVYEGKDAPLFVMQPPLRTEAERQLLWEKLISGTFDFITTDHCSYDHHQKFFNHTFYETNGGVPGTETLLPVMWSEGVSKGRITPEYLMKILSENPAKIYGLYPKKGTLKVGSDGDIVVIDPQKKITISKDLIHTAADYSVFEGLSLKGYPTLTILRGKIAFNKGKFCLGDPEGQFVKIL